MSRTTPRITELVWPVDGGIGESAQRPDGVLKVRGAFTYSSDLRADDMLWGAVVRSPYPSARIRSVDIGPVAAIAGVHAVLLHRDVPGTNRYGLDLADQPVLAEDVVRYRGEAVALVAATDADTAARAAEAVVVDYEVRSPVTDALAVSRGETPDVHPGGNVLRHVRIRRGDPSQVTPDVVVTGQYQVGMQDQAFLGLESGLAVPAADGGVDLYVATQGLHGDQRQVAAALGLPADRVRLTLAGVGGAFGAREDLSMHVHACLLALRTGRPVKMVYDREESFVGHVHRHPATLRYEHGAARDGRLLYVKADIVLDGGAYASSTRAVVANAATLGAGPYRVDHVSIDCRGVYTNNPPCGAMRGFGAVQTAFAYESQMDKLAAAVGVDPVEIRVRNALTDGDTVATGQVIDSPAPVADLLRRVAALPPPPPQDTVDINDLPGGVGNTTHGEGVRRGVGYAIGIKNICYSEGFDDYSTARVTLRNVDGEPAATVHTAAVDVGQGLVTVLGQIVRTELGVRWVTIPAADTTIGSAGSTSASRQTYVTGGAVRAACETVRDRLFALAVKRCGLTAPLSLTAGKIVDARSVPVSLADALGDDVIEHTAEWHHRRTEPIDPVTGQGDSHVQFAFAAHRAIVDVDTELGLVKVVRLDCVQDVGKAINPLAIRGQIHGGSAQGLGLALLEEIEVVDGVIQNPSFADYLLPTILDVPPMAVEIMELADPHAPYGVRGVGEPPTLSSTPAVVAAIRAATGRPLSRVPVRPEHITGT